MINELAVLVRSQRHKACLTQHELAICLGISKRTLCHVEKGEHKRLHRTVAESLATWLACSSEDIQQRCRPWPKPAGSRIACHMTYTLTRSGWLMRKRRIARNARARLDLPIGLQREQSTLLLR